MNRELSNSNNYVDDITKWLYAEEKGMRVFAIYGIGDGTEATVLYAVGGHSADSMIVWRKKYESGLDQTKRNPYRKHLDSIRVEQNKHGFGIDGNGQNNIRGNGGTTKKTTSRAGQIPNGTQRGNNRGAVPENSKQQVKGKASAEFGQYTKEQYESFGWVRANNVINAGYWRNFTENFAQAVSGNYNYPKNKDGEFMIDVYDAYDSSGVTDVIVFASGTIESPNVTKIVKIDANDSTDIEYERREILETERRGIQQKVGEFFRFYYKADFIGKFREQGVGSKENRNSGGFETKRRSSEVKANRIVEFHIDEERNTVTTTYANGETVTESLGGHASQDLDFVDFLNENLEEREKSNREILANLLETEDMSPSEKGFLTKYKNKIAQIEANEAEIAAMESELKELAQGNKRVSQLLARNGLQLSTPLKLSNSSIIITNKT